MSDVFIAKPHGLGALKCGAGGEVTHWGLLLPTASLACSDVGVQRVVLLLGDDPTYSPRFAAPHAGAIWGAGEVGFGAGGLGARGQQRGGVPTDDHRSWVQAAARGRRGAPELRGGGV